MRAGGSNPFKISQRERSLGVARSPEQGGVMYAIRSRGYSSRHSNVCIFSINDVLTSRIGQLRCCVPRASYIAASGEAHGVLEVG